MRNGPNVHKQRGRNNNNNRRMNGNMPRPQTVFDSNGPEGRIRGTAQQVYEKYIALAHDATASDDVVLTESFYQYAEHYLRVMLGDTDIDYDTYRREQQMRRDGLLNVDIGGDDFDDMTDADSNMPVDAVNIQSDFPDSPLIPEQNGQNNRGDRSERRRYFADRRRDRGNRDNRDNRQGYNNTEPHVDRMIDPPGFLSAGNSLSTRKEIKIETSGEKTQSRETELV